MSEESRVQRWREAKRQQGLKALTVWLTAEQELRLKDLAVTCHCSPSELIQQALAQFSPTGAPSISTDTDASQLRQLIREELATMQAPQAPVTEGVAVTDTETLHPVTDTVTEIVTATLARDLPALVRQLVAELALESLGVPVTDTEGNVADTEVPAPGSREATLRAMEAAVERVDAQEDALSPEELALEALDMPVTDTYSDVTETQEPITDTGRNVTDTPDAHTLLFDASTHVLGPLCEQRHEYQGSGQSLRYLSGKHECVACTRARKRAFKGRQRQAKRQPQPA
jgi:uncharacterized protein YlaN (UPF0358 family)